MAIVTHYTDEQHNNIAARIGALFELPNAGMKITREGWRMEGWGDQVQLTVELVTFITVEEAEAILNAKPIEGENE